MESKDIEKIDRLTKNHIIIYLYSDRFTLQCDDHLIEPVNHGAQSLADPFWRS